jgi:hypothetical protein
LIEVNYQGWSFRIRGFYRVQNNYFKVDFISIMIKNYYFIKNIYLINYLKYYYLILHNDLSSIKAQLVFYLTNQPIYP